LLTFFFKQLLMRKSFLYLFIFLVTANTGSSQTLRRPVATSYTGFGAYSLHHVDVFSFTANQASLAQIKTATAGLYAERRFMLAELNNYTAAAAIPTSSGNFGLKTNYAGFSDYNETQIGLAYGRKLGTKVDVGVQFNYNSIRTAGYGNSSAISFEAGAIFHLTEKLHSGVSINNPVGGKFGADKQEKLPAVYAVGVGYDASEKFLISLEIQKEEDQPVNVNAGIQYKPVPQLLIRTGIASATSSVWGGAGLVLKSFRIDVTAAFHPQLGVTPGLMLVFAGKNKKD
jgi:hypothetical protein